MGRTAKCILERHGGQRPPAYVIKGIGWRVIVTRNLWGEYVSDEWSGRRKDDIFFSWHYTDTDSGTGGVKSRAVQIPFSPVFRSLTLSAMVYISSH